MIQEHPNIAALKRLDISNLAASKELIADDIVWHYFNPNLPDLQGNYVGFEGVTSFFAVLAKASEGTFQIHPISVTPVGDELVVVQSRNTLSLGERSIVVDVVVLWRFVDGRIVQVWDIVPGDAKETQNV